jgi:glycosyltransferase involved in cell wall biosynthesis
MKSNPRPVAAAGPTETTTAERPAGMPRPIRVLYVDTETVWRGGQEQLFGLIWGLRRKGLRTLLAAPLDSPLARKAEEAGIPVVEFRQRSEFSPKAYARLRSILRNHPVDVLHFNTPTPVIPGGLAARREGVPVVVCSRRVNFPLSSRFSRHKYNWLLDRVFTVSDSIRQTLLAAGVREDLVEVIYEGADLDWIDSLPPAEVELSGRRPLIGVVAHLSQEKGHTTLLEAVYLMTRSGCPEFTVVIVGDGELRPALELMVQRFDLGGRVHFLGFRSDSEKLMKRFDIFCLPSLSEGLSSAILAAMAAGLPVVSTTVGGIPELVEDGVTGFLVPPGESEPLAAALTRLLVSPQLCRQFGAAGRRRVEASFTAARKIEATVQAYGKLLREKGLG